MDTFFGTADAYLHNLAALGHEAHEVVANCDTLQRAWARENGLPSAARPEEIVPAQMRQSVATSSTFRISHFRATGFSPMCELREALLVGQIASEAPGSARLQPVRPPPDLVRALRAARFTRAGIESDYFRIGFDLRVLDRPSSEPMRRPPLTQCSSVGLSRPQHGLGERSPCVGGEPNPDRLLGLRRRTWPPWLRFAVATTAKPGGLGHVRDPAWGEDRAQPSHRGVCGDMRTTCASTRRPAWGPAPPDRSRDNLAELFEPGREVVRTRTKTTSSSASALSRAC